MSSKIDANRYSSAQRTTQEAEGQRLMRTRDAATAIFYGQQARDCACGCGGKDLGATVVKAARDAAAKVIRDAGFDESKHPREGGKFAAGSGSKTGSKNKLKVERRSSGNFYTRGDKKSTVIVTQGHPDGTRAHVYEGHAKIGDKPVKTHSSPNAREAADKHARRLVS